MKRYWVIAPFHAKFPDPWEKIWAYDLKHGIISLGWRCMGDVSDLDLNEILKLADVRLQPEPGQSAEAIAKSRSASAHMLWKFFNEVQPGDVVIARRGTKRVAAIGTVKRAAYYDPDKLSEWPFGIDDSYPNHIEVEWMAEPRNISFDVPMFGVQTIHLIPEEKFVSLGLANSMPTNSRRLHEDDSDEESFKVQDTDERTLIERQIRERRGQQAFRHALFGRYEKQCVVTGCGVVAVLEAAHIKPYQGEKENHPENGLLLRADIHTLFDLDLLGIEPSMLQVRLHPSLKDEYGDLEGQQLRCRDGLQPSRDALNLRFVLFEERLNGTA